MAAAIDAQDLVDGLRTTYTGCSQALALDILQEVDIRVQRALKLRRQRFNLPVVAYERDLEVGNTVVWIESARYVTKPMQTRTSVVPARGSANATLEETTDDTLATQGVDWTTDDGEPVNFRITHDITGARLGFEVRPDKSSLNITNATNATPIVVTTDADHGLSDGDRVDILDVLGNTNANGEYYAKVTGYSATTFALYTDSALTTARAGNAGYTASTGLCSCAGFPYVQIEAVITVTFSLSGTPTDLPDRPILKSLYLNGMRQLYAEARRKSEIGLWKPLFEDRLAQQSLISSQEAGFVEPMIREVAQRPGGYVTRTSW